MAEPLKNYFGPEIPRRIAAKIEAAHPGFGSSGFLADALDGYEALELTPRARHIASALANHLPQDRQQAIGILVSSLGPKLEDMEMSGMEPFVYLPYVFFIAEHGLELFETSMRAQYELTQRLTAEFSIRAFIDRYPEEALTWLRRWALDPSAHVRRLVSEGTRPRLPWAPRLKRFQDDPRPVLDLLEMLKDDPEEFVRRSVANNLNDIAKDHPDLVVEVCSRWGEDGSPQRRRLLEHGLRTLIKRGHPGALSVLGFTQGSPVALRQVTIDPQWIKIGEKVRIEAVVANDTTEPLLVVADLRIHFARPNGASGSKVFKGSNLHLEPGTSAIVRKTISLAQHTTRSHYPGHHRLEILLNGIAYEGGGFDLEDEGVETSPRG